MNIIPIPYVPEEMIAYQAIPATTNIAVGDHAKFTIILDGINNKKAILDTTTPYPNGAGNSLGRVKIKAGNKFYVTSGLQVAYLNSGSRIRYAIWDVTNNIQIGSAAELNVSNASTSYKTADVSKAVIDLTQSLTDVLIELRIISITGTLNSIGDAYTRPNIEVLEL